MRINRTSPKLSTSLRETESPRFADPSNRLQRCTCKFRGAREILLMNNAPSFLLGFQEPCETCAPSLGLGASTCTKAREENDAAMALLWAATATGAKNTRGCDCGNTKQSPDKYEHVCVEFSGAHSPDRKLSELRESCRREQFRRPILSRPNSHRDARRSRRFRR